MNGSQEDEGADEEADRGPRGQPRRGCAAQRLHRCLLGGDQVSSGLLAYSDTVGSPTLTVTLFADS